MKNSVTKALVLESKKRIFDASKVYENILKEDPNNEIALEGKARLDGILKLKNKVNEEMLYLLLSNDKEKIEKFKRWLVKL